MVITYIALCHNWDNFNNLYLIKSKTLKQRKHQLKKVLQIYNIQAKTSSQSKESLI